MRNSVDIHHIHLAVQNHDALRTVVDDLIGHGLRPLAHVGQTDVNVGIAVEHSPCLLPAGRIAARAAVELILRLELAGTVQYLLYLFLRRSLALALYPGIYRRDIDITSPVPGLLTRQCGTFFPDISLHLYCRPDLLSVIHHAAGSAHTGILAHIHLKKHPGHLVDILQSIHAVLRPVHRDVIVTRRTALERMDDTAAYRVGLAPVGDSVSRNTGA